MKILPHLSKLEKIAIFSSIASFVISIFSLLLPLFSAFEKQYLTLFFVFQNAVIIFALIFLMGYFLRLAEQRAKSLEEWDVNRFEIPKSIHGFIHEMRDFFSAEDRHRYATAHSYAQLQKACNSCKEIFDRLTKTPNTVTIKMIYDEGRSFITVARDQTGMNNRKTGESNPIADNTAFSHIAISDRVTSKYYLNNILHFTKSYSNTNPHWKEQYTSTLIVPIRMNDVLVGCLSVDCIVQQNSELQGGRADKTIEVYNERNHVQLLAIFADLIYCVISKTIANQPGRG